MSDVWFKNSSLTHNLPVNTVGVFLFRKLTQNWRTKKEHYNSTTLFRATATLSISSSSTCAWSQVGVDGTEFSAPVMSPIRKPRMGGESNGNGLALRFHFRHNKNRRPKTAKAPSERPVMMAGFLYQLTLDWVNGIFVGFPVVVLFVTPNKTNVKEQLRDMWATREVMGWKIYQKQI